jgi:hypothetical protein
MTKINLVELVVGGVPVFEKRGVNVATMITSSKIVRNLGSGVIARGGSWLDHWGGFFEFPDELAEGVEKIWIRLENLMRSGVRVIDVLAVEMKDGRVFADLEEASDFFVREKSFVHASGRWSCEFDVRYDDDDTREFLGVEKPQEVPIIKDLIGVTCGMQEDTNRTRYWNFSDMVLGAKKEGKLFSFGGAKYSCRTREGAVKFGEKKEGEPTCISKIAFGELEELMEEIDESKTSDETSIEDSDCPVNKIVELIDFSGKNFAPKQDQNLSFEKVAGGWFVIEEFFETANRKLMTVTLPAEVVSGVESSTGKITVVMNM